MRNLLPNASSTLRRVREVAVRGKIRANGSWVLTCGYAVVRRRECVNVTGKKSSDQVMMVQRRETAKKTEHESRNTQKINREPTGEEKKTATVERTHGKRTKAEQATDKRTDGQTDRYMHTFTYIHTHSHTHT